MSSFRANLQKRPAKTPQRLWIEALVVGFAVEGVIAGGLMLLGNPTVFGPLLLLALAAVLGWRYGALRGAVAAVAPLLVFVVAELVREALGGTGGAGLVPTLLIAAASSLMIAAIALFAGAIRTRYRPQQPD